MNTAVRFSISPLFGNRYLVKMRFVGQEKIHFSLPIWIPGSYTRRDFSRNIAIRSVTSNDKAVNWQLVSPSSWQAEGEKGEWQIEYEVYAREYSVRGCYLDDVRGIINPCCACFWVEGLENVTQILTWQPDDMREDWIVSGAQAQDGRFVFEDYQELIDTPFMLAEKMVSSSFEAGGVKHSIFVCGLAQPLEIARLTDDVQKVCEQAIKLFGGLPPIKHYHFMLFLTEKDYGGLEHQSSTLLMAPRRLLPTEVSKSSGYIQLLGLFSHEYFHTWNVKSMRPPEYRQGYQLASEQPTEMLWLFEGFTAYFDNWLLRQSGVIGIDAYLKLLATDISRHLQKEGRKRQTLAHSSFEAWTKLYNGGENGGNISTSYYGHGSLAAWCMDVFLREQGSSLAELMPKLWQDEKVKTHGLDEKRFITLAQQVIPEESHAAFVNLIEKLIHTTDYLPLEWAATALDLEMKFLAPISMDDTGTEADASQRATSDPDFRCKEQNGRWTISSLLPDGQAAFAGLSVGDELLAVNNERVNADSLWRGLFKVSAGEKVNLSVMRDGLEHHYHYSLSKARAITCLLKQQSTVESAAQARARKWLN